MTLRPSMRPWAARLTVAALSLGFAGLPASAQAQDLKHYDSAKPDFWQHPPPDWFLGDETATQKGLAPRRDLQPG
jgi:hypothetical protein